MTDSLTIVQLLLIAGTGIAGGAVNALAGGGTLITFPMLTAVGIPPVAASITNTVALSPGYLGGDPGTIKRPARTGATPASAPAGRRVGRHRRRGLVVEHHRSGLPRTGADSDSAGGRFAGAARSAAGVAAAPRSAVGPNRAYTNVWPSPPVFAAAIYGGYFGAGLSVIVLAVLGLVLEDSLTRLNGLKQAIAFSVNITAAIFFLFSDQVVWRLRS